MIRGALEERGALECGKKEEKTKLFPFCKDMKSDVKVPFLWLYSTSPSPFLHGHSFWFYSPCTERGHDQKLSSA